MPPKISLTLVGKLCTAIFAKGKPEPHTKVVTVIGTPFTYEKMWFSGSLQTERVKLSGRDWQITIEYTKNLLTTGTMSAYGGVYMNVPDAGRCKILSYEISNEPAILRDLSTLRLAGGFDELFV